MDAGSDPPALFSLPVAREPLGPFRRRLVHHRSARTPDLPPSDWVAEHAGARGRAPSGTVHLVTDEWLPLCGAGLNGWDYRGLQPSNDAVTCRRCGGITDRVLPAEGQLTLF